MAKVIEANNPHAAWATMSVRTLANIFLYGVLVGIVTMALYTLLDRFAFEPLLCRDTMSLARCEGKQDFASGVAIIVGGMLGLVFLVRERVYRPILAIIGVTIALWGIFAVIASLPWLLAVAVTGILFGLSYVLFSWLVQPVSLVLSVAAVIVVATIARLAIGN